MLDDLKVGQLVYFSDYQFVWKVGVLNSVDYKRKYPYIVNGARYKFCRLPTAEEWKVLQNGTETKN